MTKPQFATAWERLAWEEGHRPKLPEKPRDEAVVNARRNARMKVVLSYLKDGRSRNAVQLSKPTGFTTRELHTILGNAARSGYIIKITGGRHAGQSTITETGLAFLSS